MMEIRERRLAMQDTAIASRDPLTADCVGIEPPETLCSKYLLAVAFSSSGTSTLGR